MSAKLVDEALAGSGTLGGLLLAASDRVPYESETRRGRRASVLRGQLAHQDGSGPLCSQATWGSHSPAQSTTCSRSSVGRLGHRAHDEQPARHSWSRAGTDSQPGTAQRRKLPSGVGGHRRTRAVEVAQVSRYVAGSTSPRSGDPVGIYRATECIWAVLASPSRSTSIQTRESAPSVSNELSRCSRGRGHNPRPSAPRQPRRHVTTAISIPIGFRLCS